MHKIVLMLLLTINATCLSMELSSQLEQCTQESAARLAKIEQEKTDIIDQIEENQKALQRHHDLRHSLDVKKNQNILDDQKKNFDTLATLHYQSDQETFSTLYKISGFLESYMKKRYAEITPLKNNRGKKRGKQ